MGIIRRYQDAEVMFHEGVRCVEMPCCGFTFDAGHEDMEGGWSCPLCQPAGAVEAGDALADAVSDIMVDDPESVLYTWARRWREAAHPGGQ